MNPSVIYQINCKKQTQTVFIFIQIEVFILIVANSHRRGREFLQQLLIFIHKLSIGIHCTHKCHSSEEQMNKYSWMQWTYKGDNNFHIPSDGWILYMTNFSG
jgi:hypothetical protein